ncbi:hypothetical protein [Nocardia sp. NPDC050710]|uniref:hypothetical protein n=1 Tax=Nocardia sp. NPDC050710 TaxID=3157220 RepID=UPI0033ED12A7
MLISLPAIFRCIGPNRPRLGNVGDPLWILMGYLLATAVLVVMLGRLGDILRAGAHFLAALTGELRSNLLSEYGFPLSVHKVELLRAV